MRKAKQEFPCQSLQSFPGEYYNKIKLENKMENKIIDFQFRPVCANQTRPNYTVGREQDEAQIQYDRWSTQEWCNCEKCEKISTS